LDFLPDPPLPEPDHDCHCCSDNQCNNHEHNPASTESILALSCFHVQTVLIHWICWHCRGRVRFLFLSRHSVFAEKRKKAQCFQDCRLVAHHPDERFFLRKKLRVSAICLLEGASRECGTLVRCHLKVSYSNSVVGKLDLFDPLVF